MLTDGTCVTIILAVATSASQVFADPIEPVRGFLSSQIKSASSRGYIIAAIQKVEFWGS